MSQEQAKQFLVQGINAAQAGQKDQARQLLQNALKLDPQNETAWMWMTSLARDNRERLFYLQQILEINPQNELALKGLQRLGVNPEEMLQKKQSQAGAASVGTSEIPTLSQERLGPVLSSVDEFIRGYNPVPLASQDIVWEAKSGGLYGQAAALRRRARRFGLVAGIAVVALVILLFAALSLLGDGGDSDTTAGGATFTPSFTPTPSATATIGVTNTPSPEAGPSQTPFTPAAQLVRGNVFENSPTPVYPAIPVGVGRAFEEAVRQYTIGNYEAAFETFETELAQVESSNIACREEAYFYQALGLSELGGRQNLDQADALLAQGLARPICQDNEEALRLLYAGSCVVDYVRWLETGEEVAFEESVFWCDESLAIQPSVRPVTQAVVTRARLYLAVDEEDAAAALIDQALSFNPSDVGLLLMRAEVELQRNNLTGALEFITSALFVDPLSEEALSLRVEAYLRIAGEQEAGSTRAVQLYGTAVIWTQEYLLYHAGNPRGYTLLAQARLGEGNVQQAEEALDRVIAADALPESAAPFVEQAFLLRADIYQGSARFEEAIDDIEELLSENPDDPVLLERRMNLALELERYPVVWQLDNGEEDGDLATLIELFPERADLRLIRLRLLTEVCQTEASIDCDFETAFEELDDNVFIRALEEDQRLTALSYRGKARYHLTLDNQENISNGQFIREMNDALSNIDEVLEERTNPFDLYYRGRINQALEEFEEALSAYGWVVYWSQFYDYEYIGDVHYQRGQIYETLENFPAALAAYEEVLVWDEIYDYPFIDDVEDRITAVEELIPEETEDDESSDG